MMNGNKSGFTLVELLMVTMVIGILVSIAVPVAFNARKEARIANARKGVAVISAAIEQFFQQYGRLPKGSDDEDIIKAITGGDSTQNPKEVPFLDVKEFESDDWEGEHLDPWGSQYRIYLDNDDNRYDRRISVENVTVSNKMVVVVSPGPDKRIRTKDDVLSIAVPDDWIK